MENALSGLLDQVLGYGENTSRSNRKYTCPMPDCASHAKNKKKLEIDIVTNSEGHNKYACWVCGFKGRTIRSLFRRIGAPKSALDNLDNLIVRTDHNEQDIAQFNGILPAEYKFLLDAKPTDILAKHAMLYLKKRGITVDDIIKYQIGYCDEGKYAERIIIPSYDSNGKINFFIGRTFDPEAKLKYKYPEASRDIIAFEMFINWDVPIVLCEGGFDMIAIKRNVIPLLGKTITQKLLKKLIDSKVKKIYIALDNDAIKFALKHCETMMSMGKKVFLVEMQQKDASEMGFEAFLKHIQQTEPLTEHKLLKLKLSL
jgi:DNA primase